MDTPTEDFILMDDFLKGKLDENAKEGVLRRLSFDDNFYQDFQLWSNLDDWLEELPAFEVRQALRGEVREIKKVYFYEKKPFLYLLSIACSVLVLIGVGWYLIEKSKTTPQLLGAVQYAEINASKSGSGMAGDDNSKPYFYKEKFEAVEFAQKDTTYQFIYNPFTVKLRLPKVYKNFGKNFTIIYDYKSKKYTMTLENQSFNIEESKEWKKLPTPVIIK